MIRLVEVTLSAGPRALLESASWELRGTDRVGLVGRNGVGKSTLLGLLSGALEPEAGRVERQGGVAIGYLPQQAVGGSTRSVWEEARSGATRRLALEQRLAACEAALAAGAPGADARFADAAEAWRVGGGPQLDEAVGTVLHGLGFAPADWTRGCETFSGGWRMRVALARLLLGEHDLLLLDEPTNHLDAAARTWLAGWLTERAGPLVLVSHDRWLLDRVTNRTVEIRHRRLTAFSGSISTWIAERERRDAATAAAAARQAGEVARLERFVERFGAKATKAAQAQSRVKQLERIERIEVEASEDSPRLRLPEPTASAFEQVRLERATLGHGGSAVLRDVDLAVEKGQRWVLLGPNGAGKSTLLQSLAGRIPVVAGRRVVGRDVRLAVYAQDLAQELPPDRSAVEHVAAVVPSASAQQARAALGALGLSGDAALRPIGALSGGEKARVVLAAFTLRPASLLLLDEPTNHLDVETAEVLGAALAAWDGTLVVASHDRALVEQLATHVAWVADGRVVTEDRVRPEHFEPTRSARGGTGTTEAAPDPRHATKERRRIAQRIERLFEKAESVQREVDALDAEAWEVASDRVKADAVAVRRAEAARRLDALFDEISALDVEAAALAER